MVPEVVRESHVWGPLFALGVLVTLLLVAAVVQFTLHIVIKSRSKNTPPDLGTEILSTVRGPLVLFIVILGPLLGVIILSDLSSSNWDFMNGLDVWARKVWSVVVIFEISYLVSHLSQTLLAWYIRSIVDRANTGIENKVLPPVRRVLPLVIYSVGLLVALDSLNIAISPLLAGFGIGGLAVALAVQPTLSNFFAGTYLVTEGELKEGDFIELEGGPSGFVVDVGWRSTKVRSRFNNLIIIPNSKMMDSILTNYYSPTPAMNVVVNCGVSYNSDLTNVERIVLEIARDTIDGSPYAVDNADPFFSFSEFGESNIEFFVLIQANDRTGSFLLKSDIIKKIHSRFEKEGIEINYPVRRLIYPDQNVLDGIDQHTEGT
tara:strand:- start:954 stop:2078 length:1125 start_codon:yes stop_codon:yes gene_type:complete